MMNSFNITVSREFSKKAGWDSGWREPAINAKRRKIVKNIVP